MPSAPLLKCRTTGHRRHRLGTQHSTASSGDTTSNKKGNVTILKSKSSSIKSFGARDNGGTDESPEVNSYWYLGSMKNKKTKHVKNGSSQNNNVESRSDSPSPSGLSSTALSIGAVSIIFISIFVVYTSDLLPKTLQKSDSPPISTKGGWRLASVNVLQKFGSSKCTVTRKDAKYFTNAEFEKDFRFKKPLIVSFDNGASGWTRPESWSVESLKKEYGDWLVYSGSSLEIVRRGGNGNVESSFTKFVDQLIRSKDDKGEPLYIFDRMFYNDSSLPTTLKPPKYFEIKDGRDDSIFFLGASSSGVSFHKHADAWNGVIYGEKRWFLYPVNHTPPGGVYPGFTQIEWFEKVYPFLPESEKPIECVQKAGEILYLPEGTYHGTINMGDTVAIGIQRKKASTKQEKLVYEELNRRSSLNGKLSEKEKADTHTEILHLYEELHKLLPESTEVMMKLGQTYGEHGHVEKGLELTLKAIEKDPYFVLAYLNKADLLNKLDKIEEAEDSYKKAIELNPNLWDVHAQYGSFLVNHKRPEEAIKHFNRGIELSSKQQGFYNMLRHAQKMMGDDEGAEKTERLMKQLFNRRN
ncbi:bifunctional arginine demethylase and lysyl-hydroxylase psr-1-like isoform X1 [Mytilus trossulus]|uniref:bifunctional arginine demethylase and lysyl-hydroxylase psr-1-like isoform X1 n=2 Tax=Mytilus trossulus TaxID=6551 RepID=UPI003007ED1D